MAAGGGGGQWFVTASSDLVPVIREYERTATTALNAYLTPGVREVAGKRLSRRAFLKGVGALALAGAAPAAG